MLYSLLRPALFLLPPESAHALTLTMLTAAQSIGMPRSRTVTTPKSLHLMGLPFANRVGLAAGFDKNGRCIDALGRSGFGFIEIGTVTPRPQSGNSEPRLFRLSRARALVNRMGFPNLGASTIAERLARRSYRGVCGINIGKNADTPLERAVDDYVSCFRILAPHADYVAMNFSSPNTVGLRQLQDVVRLRPILETLLQERVELQRTSGRRLPLLVKIAPDLDEQELMELASLIRALEIDGVIATNTTVQRPEDVERKLRVEGGLSGAPLHALSVMTIRVLRAALGIEGVIMGVGGIMSASDAMQTLSAGADLVQLYTGLVYRGPGLVREVTEGVRGFGF
jgi:dihydroorotate dehydrogenase